jgi:hypothetical protein
LENLQKIGIVGSLDYENFQRIGIKGSLILRLKKPGTRSN